MPLAPGKSRAAFSQNVKTEVGVGKPQKQALAIAYSEQRRGRADGGTVADGAPSMPQWFIAGAKDYGSDLSDAASGNMHGPSFVNRASLADLDTAVNSSKRADSEPEGRAFGGSASSENWLAHSAMRGMQQNHAGPINSSVAGRTDHIPMNVASGSYVVPADIVSGLGQGNTAAGHQVINKMFHSGPYDEAVGSFGRTAKPPRMKFAEGGSVPIMAAGGEHVLTPDQVSRLGGGDMKHGHEILDAWIKHERNKINKEQKKLPGPAKD